MNLAFEIARPEFHRRTERVMLRDRSDLASFTDWEHMLSMLQGTLHSSSFAPHACIGYHWDQACAPGPLSYAWAYACLLL